MSTSHPPPLEPNAEQRFVGLLALNGELQDGVSAVNDGAPV